MWSFCCLNFNFNRLRISDSEMNFSNRVESRCTCKVSFHHRDLVSSNIRSNDKPAAACVQIIRRASVVYLEVLNKSIKRQYAVFQNISRLHTGFKAKGRVTISFRSPMLDLFMSETNSSSDLNDLLRLLTWYRTNAKAEPPPTDSSSGDSGPSIGRNSDESDERPNKKRRLDVESFAESRDMFVPAVTRLRICKQVDYPITTGFQSSLRHLQITGCRLKLFDRRILALPQLASLDLTNNLISSLPESLDSLPLLQELVLAQNSLESIPASLFRGELRKSLLTLNLNSNKLVYLPETLCEMSCLRELSVRHNRLRFLPYRLDRLHSLCSLLASHNDLRVLPAPMFAVALSELDLFGNRLQMADGAVCSPVFFRAAPSLQHLAASRIRSSGLRCDDVLPRILCDYVEELEECLCSHGYVSVESKAPFRSALNLTRCAASLVLVLDCDLTRIACEGFLCSARCCREFERCSGKLHAMRF